MDGRNACIAGANAGGCPWWTECLVRWRFRRQRTFPTSLSVIRDDSGIAMWPANARYSPAPSTSDGCHMAERRCPTPDGKFTLVVDSDGVIGFDGYYWQTHVDELSQYRVVPAVSTIQELLDALAERRLVLVVSRFEDTGDEIRGVWITHDPAGEDAARDEGERLEFRYWDGAPHGIS